MDGWMEDEVADGRNGWQIPRGDQKDCPIKSLIKDDLRLRTLKIQRNKMAE